MFQEMAHGFGHRFDPLTVCTYEVDVKDVVDLRTDEGRRAADVELDDLACAWALDRASRRKPASWAIAERLIKADAAGPGQSGALAMGRGALPQGAGP